MIHYHGVPITPRSAAVAVLKARHACVSYAHPAQAALAAELCQSFVLDNGAYSTWRSGSGEVNVELYADWVRSWELHPGFDWCLIPDAIGGTEFDNERLVARWYGAGMRHGVPVWHLHESLDRLARLSRTYKRVALGSSGEYAKVGTAGWWGRMAAAMGVLCDEQGRPRCKLHGLRMLNPTVFSHLPLSSADSTNVARNLGIDSAWRGTYLPASKADRALVLAGRIEAHASASRWNRDAAGVAENLQLMG